MRRQVAHAGEAGIFDHQRRIEDAPGMTVEVSADHLPVFRPGDERDGRAVNADEALAVVADE